MTTDGIKKVVILDSRDNGSSSSSADGKPPNPFVTTPRYRRCFSGSSDVVESSSIKKSIALHPSLVTTRIADASVEPIMNPEDCKPEFLPLIRSGAWADMGFRGSMEDVYICADNFVHDYGGKNLIEGPSSFYAVFDGHGGKHAADFACQNLPKFILEDDDFPTQIDRVISSAFAQTDTAFAEACNLDANLASGTTALTALVIGSSLVVANAGDCRAVLCRRGKAIEMSRDHKPICIRERKRIETCGGYVYDGYLNGQLNVARAIGDWHMEGLKHQHGGGPLSSEPELMTTQLTEEDEFLIIGCDGIWDVFMSQNAVDFARRKLQQHNDPLLCSKDLVNEALKRKSGDNLSAVVVCFQSEPPPNLVVPRGRVQRSVSAEGLKELQSFLDGLET